MRGDVVSRVAGVALLILSVGVNVLQAQKIRTMTSPAGRNGALVGTKALPFEARTPEGRQVRVAFDAGLPTVLYYFSPTCGWCDRNWNNLEALVAGATGRYRVVAVTAAEDMKAYADKHRLGVDLLEGVPEDTLRAYGFTATPHTVVVDGSGLVTHEWRGAFMNGIAEQIEDLFGLLLPGVSAAPTSGRPK